jgi:hypothetical protein
MRAVVNKEDWYGTTRDTRFVKEREREEWVRRLCSYVQGTIHRIVDNSTIFPSHARPPLTDEWILIFRHIVRTLPLFFYEGARRNPATVGEDTTVSSVSTKASYRRSSSRKVPYELVVVVVADSFFVPVYLGSAAAYHANSYLPSLSM